MYTTFYLSSHSSMDTWVVSPSWLLEIMLLWMWVCKHLFQTLLSVLLGIYPDVGLLITWCTSSLFSSHHCDLIQSHDFKYICWWLPHLPLQLRLLPGTLDLNTQQSTSIPIWISNRHWELISPNFIFFESSPSHLMASFYFSIKKLRVFLTHAPPHISHPVGSPSK